MCFLQSLLTHFTFLLRETLEAWALFTLAEQWPSSSWCTVLRSVWFLMKKKKKRQPFEARGINWVRGPRRMSYYLVGRRQLKWHLKLTAMVNDLLGVRMPHQPLICAGRRSYSPYSVHETSTSLFRRLNYRFTSEICFLKYCPRVRANRSIPDTILVND